MFFKHILYLFLLPRASLSNETAVHHSCQEIVREPNANRNVEIALDPVIISNPGQ